MLNSFKKFLQSAWDYIEQVQTLRAQKLLAMYAGKGDVL